MNSPLDFVRPFRLSKKDPRIQYGDFLSKNEALRYEEPEILDQVDDIKVIPNNSVKFLELLKRERFKSGEVERYEVTMQNGAMYHLLNATPHEPETDVSITSTTAWLTGLDGMNKRILLAQMNAGMEASLLSTARQIGYKPSLEQAAHNQLAIAKHMAEVSPSRDDDNFVVHGISRAAMIGIGINALADRHDMNVMHNTLIAPCYPAPLSLKNISKYSHIIPDEIIAVAGMLKIPPQTLRHYVSTLDISPEGLRYAVATIPELTSGNAGKLADAMPEDTSAYIMGFEGDAMSDIHEYERKLQNHEDVVFDIRSGGAHASITHESIYQEYKRSLQTLPQEVEFAKTQGHHKLGEAAIQRMHDSTSIAA